MAYERRESRVFLQFVDQYDQQLNNEYPPLTFPFYGEPLNEKLGLFMRLREFHFYRCFYEKTKFKLIYIPCLEDLWRVCQYHTEKTICQMLPTDAWRQIHCIYGRKFRNFLCDRKRMSTPIIVSKKELGTSQSSEGNRIIDYATTEKVQLKEFIVNMLFQPYRRKYIYWTDDADLLFYCDGEKMAKIWKKVKSRPSSDTKKGAANFNRVMQEQPDYFIQKEKGSRVYQFNAEKLQLLRLPPDDFPALFKCDDGIRFSVLNGPYFPLTDQ